LIDQINLYHLYRPYKVSHLYRPCKVSHLYRPCKVYHLYRPCKVYHLFRPCKVFHLYRHSHLFERKKSAPLPYCPCAATLLPPLIYYIYTRTKWGMGSIEKLLSNKKLCIIVIYLINTIDLYTKSEF
jgi:hypothetical protein